MLFLDGYRKTYDTAIERNIPLVSIKWIENCKKSNRLLDPKDFPINLEKYKKFKKKRTVLKNYNLPVSRFESNLLYQEF